MLDNNEEKNTLIILDNKTVSNVKSIKDAVIVLCENFNKNNK